MSQSRNTLTARSVLLSVLLGTEPPRLPVRLLVRTTELFGIAEGTTRTALSRMAAAGEVEVDEGWYGLASERLLARQARQTASRQANVRPWREGGDGREGRWVQAIVAPEGRRPAADRSALRATLAGARLAELREGVWLRPDNLGGDRPPVGDEVRWFRAVPEGDPAALAARLWDLPAWADRAGELRRAMSELVGPLESGDRRSLADGFVLSAAVLRHFQADPLLPPALLPDGWPGDQLRRDYDRYDAAYRSVLRTWFGEHA
jgi:phenylacetic acid degradation operon negative regulatory protein